MSVNKKIIGIVGTGAMAASLFAGAGMAVAGAPAALGAKPGAPVAISAPKTVHSGKAFKLHCATNPSPGKNAWAGGTAVVQGKKIRVSASRTVARDGSCDMKLVLNARTTQTVRVVVKKNGKTAKSSWIKIKVK